MLDPKPYSALPAEGGLGKVVSALDPKFVIKTGSESAAKQIAETLNEVHNRAYELAFDEIEEINSD